MPKFLEQKLRAEYGNNPSAIYGTMNKIGAMHGNKETAKGREMEKKHMAKESKAKFHMTHITHHSDGSHTVEHEHHRKSSKSGAFSERPENESYSVGSGKELASKLSEHLGIGAAKAAGSQEKELEAAEHEPPRESEAEEEETSEGT